MESLQSQNKQWSLSQELTDVVLLLNKAGDKTADLTHKHTPFLCVHRGGFKIHLLLLTVHIPAQKSVRAIASLGLLFW